MQQSLSLKWFLRLNSWWCEGPKSTNLSLSVSLYLASRLAVPEFLSSFCFEFECCTSSHSGCHCAVDMVIVLWSLVIEITPQLLDRSWQHWVKMCFPGFGLAWHSRPQSTYAWVIHCQTHIHTQSHTWATYRASVHQWSCQIPPDMTPMFGRSWLSRPPCAGSPTQPRQRDDRSGVRWDSSHTECLILLCDESFQVPLLVAKLISN